MRVASHAAASIEQAEDPERCRREYMRAGDDMQSAQPDCNSFYVNKTELPIEVSCVMAPLIRLPTALTYAHVQHWDC